MKIFYKTTLLLLALMLPATAVAYDFEVDGIYYNINGNEATVTYGVDDLWNHLQDGAGYSGSVTIPETVTYNGVTYMVTAIGKSAFVQCADLTSVTIPNSVTSIGNYAFTLCCSLTSVNIPNSITVLGIDVFHACSSLTNVDIPSSVTAIGNGAFWGCSGLTSMTIPNSVTNIDAEAFAYCSSLTSVTIPNSVTFIGNRAFCECSSLTSVDIPASVTFIGDKAFNGCSNLSSLTVASDNTTYDSRDNCNAIIETASNTLIAGCLSTVIPASVACIGDWAFSGCRGLTSMTIPVAVTWIGMEAFSYCSGLTSLVVENGNTTYDSRDNCNAIIETESNTLIAGCRNTVIPNTVTSIEDWAFAGCQGLTSIIIPNSVTHIRAAAFSECFDLTSVTIPNSVTLIGGQAFYLCNSLTDVYCHIVDPSSVSMGRNVFYSVTCDPSTRTLHVPQGTAAAYQAEDNWCTSFGHIVDDLAIGAGRVDFTGGQYPAIVVKPHVSTGLDNIFVIYDTEGVAMNFTANTDDTVVWDRLDYSSGQLVIEEITDIIHTGNVTTLNQVIPNTCYRIAVGNDNIYYCWVVNYADYCLELNDLSITNESPCDLLKLNVDGHGDFINYFTVNGDEQVLDRDIKLTYNTLEWDDTSCSWQERETVESYFALWSGGFIAPPLCNTVFEIVGDRFLEEWGIREAVVSEYFYTQAVDCRSTAVQEGDEEGINGELGGIAPVHIMFSGYPTDAVAHRVWEMAIDPDFENVVQQFNQDELDYTFNDTGTYYVRYRVANEAGTCEARSDTYVITVSGLLQGDVNRDGCVDIADINAVTDIILGIESPTFAADVNSDREITIADMNAIIDIILRGYGEHEFVDLGLPSGTLWATCNIGANSPEEYGDYFAWGETEPKEVYDDINYKWRDGHCNLTKYCTNSRWGIVDNKTKLDREDDAAWVNWGPSWHMPTLEQIRELNDECRHQQTQINGVKGYLLTGPNGNSIFLPAAGYRDNSSLVDAGSRGNYWQSRLDTNNGMAYSMDFDLSSWGWGDRGRSQGMSVRAVRVSPDDNKGLYIEQHILDLGEVPMGETCTSLVTIVNDTWEDMTLTATADAPFVFEQNGSNVTSMTIVVPSNTFADVPVMFKATKLGEFDGNVVVRNPALDGGQCVIPVHVRAIADAASQQEYVDLGLPSGTLWATMNLGAHCPEDGGDHYAWGETETKETYTWDTYKWCNGSSNTLTKYCNNSSYGNVDGRTELELEDDAAYINLGPSWRMPSEEQMHELLNNCTSMNMTRNGVKGQLLIGPNGNTMFLPIRENYWSRTVSYASFYAHEIAYSINKWVYYNAPRCYGYAVRPVRLSQD